MNIFTKLMGLINHDQSEIDEEVTGVYCRTELINDDVQDYELVPALPSVDPGFLKFVSYLAERGYIHK